MTFSLAGKKLLVFSTTSVLENLTPRLRPRALAKGARRSISSTMSGHFASSANAHSGTAMSR